MECNSSIRLDMANAVQVRQVSKTYSSNQGTTVALEDVNLEVRKGEFLSVVGPSGCGKSTLLRLLGDLDEPDQGEITILDRPPRVARLARLYAIVFQVPTLLEWRTVQSNVELPLEIAGAAPAERAERAGRALAPFRLDAFRNAFPSELSSGMQMQVAIARALALEPRLLLMDEPFGALDELTRERLGLELLDLWSGGRVTIVFVTHSLSEAVLLSDRVLVMTARPGHIARAVDIDLPRPRTTALRAQPHFWELVEEARAGLTSMEQAR